MGKLVHEKPMESKNLEDYYLDKSHPSNNDKVRKKRVKSTYNKISNGIRQKLIEMVKIFFY